MSAGITAEKMLAHGRDRGTTPGISESLFLQCVSLFSSLVGHVAKAAVYKSEILYSSHDGQIYEFTRDLKREELPERM